jgi:NAD(P)H-hydrate epimerase
MRSVTAAEARRLDAETIASGTPGIVLMERAATQVAAEVVRVLARRPALGAEVVVVAGTGNNGGDGFETARLLLSGGRVGRVSTLLLGSGPDRLPADARTVYERLRSAAGPPIVVTTEDGLEPIRRATLVIDALFGTGLSRPVGAESLEAAAIRMMNAGSFVVAVDIPSGLRGGDGEVSGPHVAADVTVTFGCPKVAHVLLPAAGGCGRVVVASVGLRGEDDEEKGTGPEVVTARDAGRLLPRRGPESHKGTFGTVCVVGGAVGMAGAPALAARAAFRSGAGKVVVSAPEEVRPIVHGLCPEATTAPDGVDPSPFQALAVGPGLGTTERSERVFRQALGSDIAAVFDADALNLAAGRPEVFARAARTVLTPHPGEAARLLGVSTTQVGRDRKGAALELARRSGAAVVLKGFRSIVATPEGEVWFVLAGNPGMATGGSGDVLTGVIGAFLARGLMARDAAAAGAYLHSLAGDLATEALGEDGVIASDIVDRLPEAFVSLRRYGNAEAVR